MQPVESTYINTLYQANDGLLYIGTNGSGVLIYDPGNMSFEHYYADNSALVSNSIYTILPEMNGLFWFPNLFMKNGDGNFRRLWLAC